MFKNKKAFTLTELVIVIAIIWMLMAWMTVYLWWSDEKRKVIEAQWCVSTLLGEMNNYAFYALTSKSLRKSGAEPISPEFYRITLDWDSALKLGYSMNEYEMTDFKSLTVSNTCRQNSSKLRFNREWWNNDIHSVKMNKWFSPKSLQENRIFFLSWDNNNKYLTWAIIVSLCLDDNCTPGKSKKQIWKRSFDWRSQTISLKNCTFYNNDNSTCKTREGCKVYDAEDVTKCKEY